MNRLNRLFTLASVNVLLVTAERFSFTTKVLLQPYSFMRLHEIVQMTTLILATVILPFLVFKEVTDNFANVKKGRGLFLFILFIGGVYFYATGNGIHEVSSFNFNHYCDTKNFSGDLCGGFFINDYYTGNIFYFLGGALMIGVTLLLEKMNPNRSYSKKDLPVTLINAGLYALAIFAYAAFDRVEVGIIYSVIISVFAGTLWLKVRKKYLRYPVITYTAATYILGTIAALLVRYYL